MNRPFCTPKIDWPGFREVDNCAWEYKLIHCSRETENRQWPGFREVDNCAWEYKLIHSSRETDNRLVARGKEFAKLIPRQRQNVFKKSAPCGLEGRELKQRRKGNWKQRVKASTPGKTCRRTIQEGEDPETFLFEVPGENSRSLEENAKNLEEKLEENSRNLEEKLLESLEDKLLENTEGLKKELCGVANRLEKRIGTVEAEMDKMKEIISDEIKDGIEAEMDKIKETISKLEKQINSASSTEMVNENAMLDLSLNVDKVQEGIKDVKVISEIGKLSMKPPQFDGKTPWANYRRQFEAAAKANGWNAGERAVALTLALRGEATNILQTLTAQEQEDYDQLIKHLELRYGHAHFGTRIPLPAEKSLPKIGRILTRIRN
ncbi:hypothetical protein JTB14_005919 [Gonioctena quinquepunctata]|nr:hypothetical protein JTB14_005919 [Gonioctena quinquepunctata]